jgi:putative chitinase
MAAFSIASGERPAMFVAQVAHESGRFQFVSEIWGPTPQQLKYDNGSELSRTLGNQAGDGFRYRGHGLIQVTGRANHEAVARRFGIPIEDIVGWLTHPEGACLSAAHYWASRGCNELADAFDFVGVTKKINGGLNGLSERVSLYQKLVLQP